MAEDDILPPHITGFFVRVLVDGKWRNLDIATLTDAQLDEFFIRQGTERHVLWAKALAGWIRDHCLLDDGK